MVSLRALRYLRATNPLICSNCKAKRVALRWSSTTSRQWSTPLAKTIAEAIETTGPISIASYMRQCLTSSEGGYYTRNIYDRDQFGAKGDFITSPEISQVFGELVGLWIVSEWMIQGKKTNGVEIIELGPGRGTLIDDVLRTLRNFKEFTSCIESVYLVEASKPLRKQQKQLLCGEAEPLEETSVGYRSRSKYDGLSVTWCEDIRLVPNDSNKTPFLLAHEFFDALPIHAFKSVAPSPSQSRTIQGLHGPIALDKASPSTREPQWRELVVTPNNEQATLSKLSRTAPSEGLNDLPEFQLSVAKASTPPSLVLPEASSRYKALKGRPDSVIEISAEGRSFSAEFARRVGGANLNIGPEASTSPKLMTKTKPSGAALIIDYGPAATIPTSTLRGIRSHKLVSPFLKPGEVDLSADVDFTALAESALDASEGVEVHGPIEQGAWLKSMGLKERVEILCKNVTGDEANGEATAQKIKSAADRLIERSGGAMGKLYKFLAIIPERDGRRPVGFGGELRV